jgi:Matrixin
VVDMNQWASNAFAFAVPFAYSGAMLAAPASAYRIDANSVHTSDGAAAVQAAAATWSAACPLTFTYEGTCATTAFAQDGHNDVFWTPSLPGGVPAQTRLYYNDDQTQIVEWDMALNDAYDWGDGSGGTYDVRSTVLHELGHALGLADLYGSDQAKVMFGVPLAAGSVKRSLSADDVAGAQWIYGPATVLTLADALDGTGLAWTSDGAAPWFGQRLTYHAGAGAAQSGAVGDGQSSSVQTAVVGPGVLSYWTKVSSAPGDGLTFFVDDLAQTAPVSGEVDWVQSAVPIAAGMHDLRWTYSKDGAGAAGADCAWLDAVQYVPTEGPYGTMTINGGDQYATSLTVTVDSSVVGAASMRLSCDGGAWSAWQDYAGATQVTLPAGEGQHTIAADYKDAEGAPLALSDDITVDTVAPGVTGLASSTHQVETTWYANSAPAFTWSATDASGIGGYSWTLDHAAGTLPDTTTDGAAAAASLSTVADGTWYFHVRAQDGAGNWGPAATRMVRIDTTPPQTVAHGGGEAWHRGPVKIKLSAGDAGSGVDYTSYSLDGGDWKRGSPAIVKAEGKHTLEFRSVDHAGNIETAQGVAVWVDNSGPRTVGTTASVRHGQVAHLGYRVNDKLSPLATVVIKIRSGHGAVVKTLKLGRQPTNLALVGSFKCTLGAGAYRFTVYARDVAGNPQAKAGNARLTVL